MKPPSPAELMQYADGELPAERARELSAWLSEDQGYAAAEQVQGIHQTGAFVRARADYTSASFDVVDQVMARLDTAPAGHLRVVAGPGGSSPRHAPIWLSLGAAGLAAAAAVALLVTRPSTNGGEPQVVATRSAPAEAASAPPEAQDIEGLGASVERLDPGSKGASLFVVQAGAVTTPVVWLLDDPEETGDRMGPL